MGNLIHELKNDLLKTPCEPFDFSSPSIDPEILFEEMKATMIHNNGLGLTCNQVGLPWSMFTFGHPSTPNNIMCAFNPVIVDVSQKIVTLEEGCLSFPGIIAKIPRPELVRLRFSNEKGIRNTAKFSGLSARIILHEMDHIQGKIFLQNISRFKIERVLKQTNKRGYNYRISEFL